MELRIQTEACENLHLQEEQVRRDILLQNTKMLGKRESMSKLELYNIYAGYEESKPVLKDISFWNEQIFLDMADWDFCWRLKEKKYQIMFF